jgi:preprotein translocase subunit SecB
LKDLAQEPPKSPEKMADPVTPKVEEKPDVEQTFLSNDVFKTIKEKYMRDSV